MPRRFASPLPLSVLLAMSVFRWHILLLFLLFGNLMQPEVLAEEEPLEPWPLLQNALGQFVESYCIDCHGGDEAEAGVSLEKMLASGEVNHHRKAWKKTLKLIRSGRMPPEESDAPSEEERNAAIEWLDAELKSFDCSGPQRPGHVTLRRLNRTEYRNTIRDLMGVEFDPSKTFPSDTLGYGFDNIGDTLSLSPLLVEKYLNAAEKITGAAIVAPESIVEPRTVFSTEQFEGGDPGEGNTRSLYTAGRNWVKATFAEPGEYILRVRASADPAGDENALMKMELAGQELRTVEVAAVRNDPQVYLARFSTEETEAELGVSFLNDFFDPENPDTSRKDRNLHVHGLELVGPLDENQLPDSHRLVLPTQPSSDAWADSTAWQDEATELVSQFLGRAFRRSAKELEIERAMQLLTRAHRAGDSFERGMQLVAQLALVSPSFLFRGEPAADEMADASEASSSEQGYLIDEYRLATRLSYFLWSSMPDEELFREASAGTLRANLDEQLDRMIDSERSSAFIVNFGEQWLETRQLEHLGRPRDIFPKFNKRLPAAMRKETNLFLTHVYRNELPIVTLLNADFSFVNEQLATHYGIEGIEGKEFRRVELPEIRRAGLLAHGSVLAITSHPDRTSPVLRGRWIMQHLLNDAPPPPPMAVDLPEKSKSTEGKSLRERLEIHRESPSCSVCHETMDQLGFALENFDAIGQWREKDEEFVIDSSGKLPDGREFSGPAGLRDVLVAELDAFRKCLIEQVLTYSLGRGLEYYDQCAVEQIAEEVKERGDSLSAIVRGVVRSVPFQRDEMLLKNE